MVRLNDHYFLSWINVVKQKPIKIENGRLYVDITSIEYSTFLKEYNLPLSDYGYGNVSAKKLCQNIRRVIKRLNSKSDSIIEPLNPDTIATGYKNKVKD